MDASIARRAFLGNVGAGMGSLALASLLDRNVLAQDAVRPRHVLPKARRVLHLFMAGGPSHLETLDYKPKLAELHGQPMPESVTKNQPIAQLQGAKLTCFGPQWPFARYGKSGQQVSTAFPHIGSIADEIAIVRSLVTEQINHDPAQTFINTGTSISGSATDWSRRRLSALAASMTSRCAVSSTPAGRLRYSTGSPRDWNCTPWNLLGRKPEAHWRAAMGWS